MYNLFIDLDRMPTSTSTSRKKANVVTISPASNKNIVMEIDDDKKRGRKPKGGKIITKTEEVQEIKKAIPNIILHLKCSIIDLQEHYMKMNRMMKDPLSYSPDIPLTISTYNVDDGNAYGRYTDENSGLLNERENIDAYKEQSVKLNTTGMSGTLTKTICSECSAKMQKPSTEEAESYAISMKDVHQKLTELKILFKKNGLEEKKSACFWCTFDYDNPTIYIPKYEMDEQIYGYGSFCRPECAVAYLMKENIDDSTKFERYHLLNQIYSKIYNHKNNIKPAPNPYYTLERYYGNLSIQEYRKLLKTEHMLLVVEKPMTRILPELFEDNDNFILNVYGNNQVSLGNQNSMYKVKRQSDKMNGPSKNTIMKDNFGI